MTSLIAEPIKVSQIFYMIRLATKFTFYNILHSFFVFSRHNYDLKNPKAFLSLLPLSEMTSSPKSLSGFANILINSS